MSLDRSGGGELISPAYPDVVSRVTAYPLRPSPLPDALAGMEVPPGTPCRWSFFMDTVARTLFGKPSWHYVFEAAQLGTGCLLASFPGLNRSGM